MIFSLFAVPPDLPVEECFYFDKTWHSSQFLVEEHDKELIFSTEPGVLRFALLVFIKWILAVGPFESSVRVGLCTNHLRVI